MATEEMIGRLVDLNVIEVNDTGYDYTEDFKDSVRQACNKHWGYIEKARYYKTVSQKMAPILRAMGTSVFKDKKTIDILNNVIFFFTYYVKTRKKDRVLKDREISNILYALYCLDHQIPEVEV